MKFEDRPVEECVGWSLAHSLMCGGKRLAKATELSVDMVEALTNDGISSVQVFQIEEGDLAEDQAAHTAAELISGENITIEPAGRGRANLIATCDGLFEPNNAIDALNGLDDAFSAASKPAFARVGAGQLVATIKLIPYGVPADSLQTQAEFPTCRIAAFAPFSAALIITGEDSPTKTLSILSKRLDGVGGHLEKQFATGHSAKELSQSLATMGDTDLILLLGASAISDQRDVLPAALIAAGGHIVKLGLPTDPGNLLMYGEYNGTPVVGLPGCARSPALNGFDWVLERFAARLLIDHDVLTSMGTGGLLKEPAGRQVPRNARRGESGLQPRRIAAVVLAAGRSTRSGSVHKLLSQLGDRSVIAATLASITADKTMETFVVTGALKERVEEALGGHRLTTVHNSDFDAGMGTSIAKGVKTLPDDIDYALICLGDMPFVKASSVDALCVRAQQTAGPTVFVPTFHGKRGHPVLWHRSFFAELSKLDGETGGKRIIERHREKVIEVPVDDPGILIDLDTPDALSQFGVTPVDR